MRTSIAFFATLGLILAANVPAAVAGGCGYQQEATCGCSAPRQAPCVHCRPKHCHRHCYATPHVPQGMLVESMPMARISPMLVAAPMMMSEAAYVRPVTYAPEARRQESESDCSASSSRLAELESRIRRMEDRFDEVQNLVKDNTRILLKLEERLK